MKGYFTDFEGNRLYDLDEPVWKAPNDSPLNIYFPIKIDPLRIKNRKYNLWRYREAIPLNDDRNIISFDEGFTPLLKFMLNGRTVFIKQDHLFQTGSYKDRGAAVLISKVKELGIRKVVQDSSGNAGASVAAYCAKAGIECEIFVPAQTSRSKLKQIEMYGARLFKINGSREDAASAAFERAEKFYYASHCRNPFFFQGTKTFAYEICEQLNWKSPDAVILPAGNGTLILGWYLGFKDLILSGITEKLPKIIAVQAERCAPLKAAFDLKSYKIPVIKKNDTIAEGIAIAEPVRGEQMMKIIYESDGKVLTVSEEEIVTEWKNMSRRGFYIEPTSAATIAGMSKYLESASEDELIVTTFTGSGLKSSLK